MPEHGDQLVYEHPQGQGFGEAAKGITLTADMRELDMAHGTVVTFLEYDADSGWPLVEWTDGTGIQRITTIDPVVFGSWFNLGQLCY
jgi:hypothetical protein